MSWSKPSISITYEFVIVQEKIRFIFVREDLLVQLGSLHVRKQKEDIIYKIPGLSSSTKYSCSSIQMNEWLPQLMQYGRTKTMLNKCWLEEEFQTGWHDPHNIHLIWKFLPWLFQAHSNAYLIVATQILLGEQTKTIRFTLTFLDKSLVGFAIDLWKKQSP